MSGVKYIPADVLDDAKEAIRNGRSLTYVAGQLQVDPSLLASLLGIRASEPVPEDKPESVDLWSSDALDAVL